MKKLLILIGLVLSFTMNAQISPNIQWQKALGGSNNDGAYSIQQTSDGGYIMAGVTLSNDGDVSGNHSSNDVWAVKLSSTGIIQWQKALGGLESDEAFTIQQTADEGYIIAGVTFSNDGDVSGNHGGADAWVVKLSATGEIQWQKALGGLESDRAFTIQQTADEGYIIAGLTGSIDGDGSGNQVSDDAWVVKLSSTGIIQWQKALGGLVNDQASTIQQTADGGYIMAGITGSNDGDVSGNHGSYDAWVVKLSATGEIQWQKALGGSNDDLAFTIQQTADGGYIMAGVTGSNDGDVFGNHGSDDAWVVKLSSTGTIQWQKCLGGSNYELANNIQQTSDGGYIVAGYAASNDGDVSGNHGSEDAWVVKLSATGEIQWQKALGGSNGDLAFTIQQTADGGYIMAGITGSNDGDVSGNHGSSDAWVVKLSSDQLSTTEFSNISLKLYPNPTYSLINIQTSNNVVLDKIIITDLMGKTVIKQTQNTNQVSVEKLATGVYILNGYSEGNKFQEKFIKE